MDLPGLFHLYSLLDWVFLMCALLGGLLFIARSILQLGFGHDDSADAGADAPHDGFSGHHDTGLRLLTVQGLIAFVTMFGLVGLALSRSTHAGEILSILGGFAGGSLTCFALALLTAAMRKLQSTGNLRTDKAVGATGTVYLTIPRQGSGQVQLVVDGRQRIFDAVAEDKGTIPSGARVTVTEVQGDSLMIVRKL